MKAKRLTDKSFEDLSVLYSSIYHKQIPTSWNKNDLAREIAKHKPEPEPERKPARIIKRKATGRMTHEERRRANREKRQEETHQRNMRASEKLREKQQKERERQAAEREREQQKKEAKTEATRLVWMPIMVYNLLLIYLEC